MSSKKKVLATRCEKCELNFLSKDTERHKDWCGKNVREMDMACEKNGVMKAMSIGFEKAESFMPPDSIGWEREHSILMSVPTMEKLGLMARDPIHVEFDGGELVGVVWPCKEVPLFKIHALSSRIPRERLVSIEKLNNVETVEHLSVEIGKIEKLTPSIRNFIEMYFRHSYLLLDFPISLRYLGISIDVTPRGSLEQNIAQLSISDSSRRCVIATSTGCRVTPIDGVEKEESVEDLKSTTGAFETRKIIEDYLLEPLKRKEEPCSILLWGIPGSGKTFLLRRIAKILGSTCLFISKPEDLSERISPSLSTAVVIMDLNEVDKEDPKMSRSILEVLENPKIATILSVRSSENLDLGLRVKFNVETEITVPTQEERIDILKSISMKYGFDEELIFEIARITHGFTVGDLCSLLKVSRYSRGETQMKKIEQARKQIRPTGIRQFILEVPNVSWSDIGGNEELKLEIQQAVIWPQRHPEAFSRFGIDPPAGILLYGPPGCSKTLIARALANEARMNFLAVKGPELFSKWVGDSEKAIRDLFSRARQVAPTIVFFDEIDAVGSSRGSEKSSGVSDRVLAQLLTELDGLEKSARVILLAATNRPDQLDSALLRPGRLDRAICVGLPSDTTRKAILEMQTRKMRIEEKQHTIDELIKKTEGYSGAELVAVCRTAAMFAMREDINAEVVEFSHFEKALMAVVPRTEAYLLEIYEDFKAGRTSNA